MALPYDTYYNIQTNSDLVTLIGRYLPLTPGRKAYKGNCPFHQDELRSLMVSAEKNIFKCFGCGTEGGPVEFLMKIDKLTLADAVNSLAAMLDQVEARKKHHANEQLIDRLSAETAVNQILNG